MIQFLKKNTIALVSIIIALTTLYLTQFRKADIEIYVADKLLVWYAPSNATGIIAPISLINRSNRLGSVARVVMIINRRDTPEQNYVIEWKQFDDLVDGLWTRISETGTLAVPANGSISKQIRFEWTGQQDLKFRVGTYDVDLFVWEAVGDSPITTRKYSLIVDQAMFNEIAENSGKEAYDVTRVPINGGFSSSIVLNKHELERILYVK